MIEAKNLEIRVKDKTILHDFNFSLADAGWTSIIGPNGSGKSTLIKGILGVLSYSGSLTENGREVYRNRKRDLAYIPQRPTLPDGMRVAEYVSLAHLKHRSSHTKEVLEELEIFGLHDQPLATLSGGELQLVTLARAIAQKPKLILLDEPTSALDLNHQMRALSLINELKESGIRIISVMHDLTTVGLYCDDLLLVNQGRLLIHGKSDVVLHSPLLNEAYENSIDIFKLDSGRSIIYGKDFKRK